MIIKSGVTFASLVVLLSFNLIGTPVQAQSITEEAGVMVHRGGGTTRVTAASQAVAPGTSVVVHRGAGPVESAEPSAQESVAGQPFAAAGRKLWLVQPAKGKVVGCQLRGTSTVGKRKITCAKRKLARSNFY